MDIKERVAALRSWLERLLLWRVWERMLELEFVDRGVALAGKAFVSFFPLTIVVAAFLPEGMRESIVKAITVRFGLRGDALDLVQQSFASSEDLKKATGLLGLTFTILFATSFTTALQRVYLRAWRRPPRGGLDKYWRGPLCLAIALGSMALLGGVGRAIHGPVGVTTVVVLALATTAGAWLIVPWILLRGDVRLRVLIPTALITSVITFAYSASASVWMPETVTSNEAQFGLFGVALALVSWFSGAAICILIGACFGPVLAEDTGWLGSLVRGSGEPLRVGAVPSLPAPARDLTLRDAFQGGDEP